MAHSRASVNNANTAFFNNLFINIPSFDPYLFAGSTITKRNPVLPRLSFFTEFLSFLTGTQNSALPYAERCL